MRFGRKQVQVVGALSLVMALAWACKNGANDVNACREIEDARCEKAPACGVPINLPPHPDSNVSACIRFYDVACDHGLQTTVPPSASEVAACVDAINSADCKVDASIVFNPQNSAACGWLIPPGTTVASDDAGVVEDAGEDAADASSDAASDAADADAEG